MNLKGKNALVTGGGVGIGRTICLTLAEYGCNVIVNYNNSKDSANEVVKEIIGLGRKAVCIGADVSDITQVDNMVDKGIVELGSIDILVNNAGFTKDNYLILMTQEDWSSVIDTNLTGVFNCCKIVAKNMISNRYGRIINLSSISGIKGLPGQVNYSAAKAGIIGMTKSLSLELARFNILVNAVAPGLIETKMIKDIPEKNLKKLIENIPLQRTGTPKEVSEVVSFLASPGADYITGQVIEVAGGL